MVKSFKKVLASLAALIMVSIVSYAQQTVRGTVKDTNGDPVPGVAVMLKGSTTIATISDINGAYTLTLPSETKNPVLYVSCLGFKEKNIEISGRGVIDIVLQEDTEELEDAGVIGYGSTRKSDLTGAVSSVKVSDDEKARTGSLDQLLQGRAAGVQVVSNNAAPDAGVSVRIRGLSSFFGNNEPLYVIDGIIMNPTGMNEAVLSVGADNEGTEEAVNGLMGLSPQDIANIEILKDASATAIYGALGANGVVLITTKTAQKDRPTVNFSSGVDISHRYKRIDILSFDEYITFLEKQNAAGISTDALLASIYDNPADRSGLKVTPRDWQDYVFRTVVGQRYHLSITGRPKSTTYAFSVNYIGRDGIIKNSGVKSISMRLNIEKSIFRGFKVGTKSNLAYIYSNQTQSSGKATAATSLMRSVLTFRPYEAINPDAEPDEDYELDDVDNNSRSGPDKWLNDYQNTRKEFRATPSFYAWAKIAENTTFKSTIGADYRDSERAKFKSSRINSTSEGSVGAIGSYRYLTWNWDNTINYKYNKRGHNLNMIAGSAFSERNSYIQSVQGWNINQYRGLAESISTAPNASIVYDESMARTLSFFVRGIYNWRDRYVLTATYRADGSSKFQGTNKWAGFPSLAFAWRMNEESWFNSSIISQAKLRLGWGRVGNQAIANYQTLSNYSNSIYADHTADNVSGYSVGIVPANLANPNLKWETTEQTNVGLDLSFWHGYLVLNVDAYNKVTFDLLQSKRIATSSGFTTMYVNEGVVRNRGIEFSMEATALKTRDLEWRLNGNISFNRNAILSINETANKSKVYLDENTQIDAVYFYGASVGSSNYANSSASIFMVGYPMCLFYGYKTDGIVQVGETGPALLDGGALAQPGHLKMHDTNGNGYIDADDRMIIGNPNPKFTFGFGTELSYKNLTLSVSCNGSYGNDIINVNNMRETDTAQKNHNILRAAMYDSWTPENPDAKYWAIGSISSTETRALKDIDLEDGSYLRVANVSLSYDFPIRKDAKVLRGLSFGLSAANLLIFTKYSGWDPDVNSFGSNVMKMGADSGSYPSARTFSADVKFTF